MYRGTSRAENVERKKRESEGYRISKSMQGAKRQVRSGFKHTNNTMKSFEQSLLVAQTKSSIVWIVKWDSCIML